jgi:hypothetical protein
LVSQHSFRGKKSSGKKEKGEGRGAGSNSEKDDLLILFPINATDTSSAS